MEVRGLTLYRYDTVLLLLFSWAENVSREPEKKRKVLCIKCPQVLMSMANAELVSQRMY